MAWVNLPTNFKNLVWQGLKKFRQFDNGDDTVSFEDVTVYQDTENTQMSAAQLNQMTGALNDIMNGNVFYTESEVDTLLAGKANSSHAHDDRYYTEEEVDTLLLDKADADDVYTKQETDSALALKADIADLGALAGKDQAAWSTDISGIPSAFPPESHNHDDRYYIKPEIDTALTDKADAIVCEASGNPVSVSDGSASSVRGLSVGVEPVQDLNGYDHPWPAGGGKNLWNGSNGYWAAADGTWTTAGNALSYQSSQKFMVSEGDVFYVSPADNPVTSYVMTWLNGTYVGFVNGPVSICQPYTVPAGVDEIAFDLNFGSQEAALAAKVMMNRGSTPESYEPYANVCPILGWPGAILTVNGTSVLVSFPTAAGMVYGGTLDVTNGVLTVDREIVDLGALNWNKGNYFSSGDIADRCKYPSDNNIAADAICSIYPVVARNSLVNKTISIQTGGYIVCSDDLYTDTASFKTAMNGVQFVFKLAAPIMYQLTPMEVRTVLGNNVISADCGPVSVKYHADPKLYINNNDDAVTESANAKITENIESETTATKNYTAGSLAIVQNQLIRVTQNIASGGNITIGSNAEVVELETLFGEKAEKSLVAKLPYLSSAELYNDIAEFHNANPRGKSITAYLTDGSLWDRINGTNGYSLFEDLYVGDYLTAGGQDYVIVDFDYYIRCGDSHDLTAHHLVMMPVTNMNIPEGTVLYNTDSSAEVETLQLINTVNYREYTGDSSVSVSSQETAVWKKWNASIDAPNTNTTAGGYKFSRMRQVIMKAADTIVRSAFGADHVKAIDVLYPNPADAAASGTVSSWAWFKNTDWNDDLRMSICDLPNEVQIYGSMVFAVRGYEVGIDKWQFSLFRYDRRRANIRSYWWLRSVASGASAAFVTTSGIANTSYGTSYAFGVRPRFLLVG